MAMMMQTGASASKVLILVGAGLTGTVVLRSGKLSDIILQLQELLKGVNESEISPEKYDGALLASQIQQLAREIRELTLSRPVTICNGNGHSTSDGCYASYLMPAAALGAMGYCYMWWKGWSISDVMFVTKHNMANAVSTVAKQLENVNEALTSTKRHLSKRLENLDWKMEEQKETSKFIANDVQVVKSDLTQIGCDVEIIHQLVSGLEGKIELLESKQDMTNSGLWHLCQMAGGGVKEGINGKLKGIRNNLAEKPTIAMTHNEASLKGLQFIVEPNGVVEDSTVNAKKFDQDANPAMAVSGVKPRIHSRSHAFGISSVQNITGL